MRMSVSVAERLSGGGEAFEELAKTMKRLHHSCSWPFVSRANAHLVELGRKGSGAHAEVAAGSDMHRPNRPGSGPAMVNCVHWYNAELNGTTHGGMASTRRGRVVG
jgi:hypothetical protein